MQLKPQHPEKMPGSRIESKEATDFRMRKTMGATILLSVAMVLPVAMQARAESMPERGQASLKYLDYQESQPGADRILVHAAALEVLAPVAGEWALGATLVADSISGASPIFHTTGLTKMHDRRNALDVSATKYISDASVTLGTSVSTESDYFSRGLSLQGNLSSESRNTAWTAGIGINSDDIHPTTGSVKGETKHVSKMLVGVTQVLTPDDIVQANIGVSRGRGYFSDPYKIFDNRPRQRLERTLTFRWNHYLAATGGVFYMDYRYFTDSWDIKSHTLDFEYSHPLGDGWNVAPLLRLYDQSAAGFYMDDDPRSNPFSTVRPNPAAYRSGDQRLSAFGGRTLGIKVGKQIDADWRIDFKAEHYEQRSEWRFSGGGSPGLLPFRARMFQFGLSRQF